MTVLFYIPTYSIEFAMLPFGSKAFACSVLPPSNLGDDWKFFIFRHLPPRTRWIFCAGLANKIDPDPKQISIRQKNSKTGKNTTPTSHSRYGKRNPPLTSTDFFFLFILFTFSPFPSPSSTSLPIQSPCKQVTPTPRILQNSFPGAKKLVSSTQIYDTQRKEKGPFKMYHHGKNPTLRPAFSTLSPPHQMFSFLFFFVLSFAQQKKNGENIWDGIFLFFLGKKREIWEKRKK